MSKNKVKPKLKIFSGEDARLRILAKAYKVAMDNDLDWNHISVEANKGDYENFFKILWENYQLV